MKKRTVITTEKHEVWVISWGAERPEGAVVIEPAENTGAESPARTALDVPDQRQGQEGETGDDA